MNFNLSDWQYCKIEHKSADILTRSKENLLDLRFEHIVDINMCSSLLKLKRITLELEIR